MRHVAGYSMVVVGFVMLTTSLFMKFGGVVLLLKTMMAISVKNAPLNETFLAWVDVPMPMSVEATLNSVSLSEEVGFMGVQHVDCTLKLTSEGVEQAKVQVTPIIFGSQDGSFDEPQRHVLKAGPLNIPNILSYSLAFFSLITFLVALRIRFRKSHQDKTLPPNHPMQFLGSRSK